MRNFPIATVVVRIEARTTPLMDLSGVCSTRSKYPAIPTKKYEMISVIWTLKNILSILFLVGFLRSNMRGNINWWLTKQNMRDANPCICIDKPSQSHLPNHTTLSQLRCKMPPYSQYEPMQSDSGGVKPVKRVIVRTTVLKTVANTPIIATFWRTPIYFFRTKTISSARPPTFNNTLIS